MKWQWMVGGLLLVAPFVGGCSTSADGPSLGNLGRNFADDWTGARSIDKASVDLLHGNIEAVQEAGKALDKRIESGSRASFNIAIAWMTARSQDGGQSAAEASQSEAGAGRDFSHRESDRNYRAALAFLPSNPQRWKQLDPQLLNGLGYFLADRGRDKVDFERAEKLTALALQLTPTDSIDNRYFRATGPQDSHAWALFRLGRTQDALREQSQVVSTISQTFKGNTSNLTPAAKSALADIIYHWGAICRVAGREGAARDAFKYAQTLYPSPELSDLLNVSLSGDVV